MKEFEILVTHWKGAPERKDYLDNLFSLSKHTPQYFTDFDKRDFNDKSIREKYSCFADQLSLAVICNFLNHLKCYKYIKENLEVGLIIEDDMVIPYPYNDERHPGVVQNPDAVDFDLKLETHINYFKDNVYDLAWMGGPKWPPTNWGHVPTMVWWDPESCYYDISDTKGTDCYFVSNKAARALIDFFEPLASGYFDKAMDWELKVPIKKYNMKVFHTFPMDFMTQGSKVGMYESAAGRGK